MTASDPPPAQGAGAALPYQDRLRDFSVDRRLLILTPMAAIVGVISALVAYALVRLIGAITNLVYYHRLSPMLVSPADTQLGLGSILIPMAGGRRSILTEKVARRGYHVMREYIVNPLTRVRVADVMERNAPTIPADQRVDLLFRRLAAHDPVLGRRYAWPLVDEAGALAGIVTRGDLVRALEWEQDGGMTVLEAGSSSLVVTYPDQLLDEALEKMVRHNIGRLPVVERTDPTRLLGYLGRTSVTAGWRNLVEEEQVRDTGWLSRRIRRRPGTPGAHPL